MQFLFEHRVATRDQIGRRYFAGRGQPVVQRRLEVLHKAGFLAKAGVLFNRRSVAVYSLHTKGLELVAESFRYPVTNLICKSDSVHHDLCLVDLRERFERTTMLVEYISENVLQACGTFRESEDFRSYSLLNSDAVLTLDTAAGKFNAALEYEGSPKSVARYARKLRGYYLSQAVEAVFYVCGNAGVERVIRHAEMEVAHDFDPKIFICSHETVQKGILPLPFIHRKNGRFLMT